MEVSKLQKQQYKQDNNCLKKVIDEENYKIAKTILKETKGLNYNDKVRTIKKILDGVIKWKKK